MKTVHVAVLMHLCILDVSRPKYEVILVIHMYDKARKRTSHNKSQIQHAVTCETPHQSTAPRKTKQAMPVSYRKRPNITDRSNHSSLV